MKTLVTTVTERGQVSIPAEIRARLQIHPGTRVEWVLDRDGVRLVPIPDDPVGAFRGAGSAGAVERLLADRTRDR